MCEEIENESIGKISKLDERKYKTNKTCDPNQPIVVLAESQQTDLTNLSLNGLKQYKELIKQETESVDRNVEVLISIEEQNVKTNSTVKEAGVNFYIHTKDYESKSDDSRHRRY